MKETSSTQESFKRKVGRPKSGSPVPPPVEKGKVGRPPREVPILIIDHASRPESQSVTQRYMEAVDELIKEELINSHSHLAREMSTSRTQFTRMRKDPSKYNVPIFYLWYLIDKFGISADWLLTGRGTLEIKK